MLPVFLISALTVLNAAPPQPLAAVVVMSKEPIPPSALDTVGNRLTQRLEASGKFLRVTSHADVFTSLGVDLRREVQACPDAACMGRVAQPLGVDRLYLGMIMRMPAGLVLGVRVLDVRTGNVLQNVDQPLPGEAADGWSRAVDDAGARLLGIAVAAEPAPVAAAPASHQAKPTVTTEKSHSTHPAVWAGRAISAAGVAALGLALVVTIAGAAVAGGVYGLFTRVRGFDAQRTLMQGLLISGLGGVAVGVMLMLLAGGLGVAGGAVATVGQ